MTAFGVHVLTDGELQERIAREKFEYVREVRRAREALRTARVRWEKEHDDLVGEVEYLKQRIRKLTATNPDKRRESYRKSSNKRYERYRYLCELHGISRQNKRWSLHLGEIERTLRRVEQ